MNTRRIATTGIALATALTLTACGSSSSPSASTPKTSAAPSDNASATAPAVFTPLTKDNFASVLGARAAQMKTVHMKMMASVMNVNAELNYGPPFSMQMTVAVTQAGKVMNMSLSLIGTVMYMQVPGLTPAGKYMSMDLSKVPQASQYFQLINQYKNMGPKSMLADMFKGSITKFAYVGPAQINGQPTRHYTVSVNTASALKALGSLSSSVPQGMKKTVTEQIYLDSSQMPVRVSMSLPAPVGAMQIDFSDWGKPVSITAPPASDVQQIPAGTLAG
jgi:hypothetical protein